VSRREHAVVDERGRRDAEDDEVSERIELDPEGARCLQESSDAAVEFVEEGAVQGRADLVVVLVVVDGAAGIVEGLVELLLLL
jgi:hypothetical protein